MAKRRIYLIVAAVCLMVFVVGCESGNTKATPTAMPVQATSTPEPTSTDIFNETDYEDKKIIRSKLPLSDATLDTVIELFGDKTYKSGESVTIPVEKIAEEDQNNFARLMHSFVLGKGNYDEESHILVFTKTIKYTEMHYDEEYFYAHLTITE